jgi:hypothetical protein
MSLFKLIAGIGQGALNGGKMVRTSNWVKIRDAYRRNMVPKTKGNALNIMVIHERNGSRGDGIGMGRRNNLNRNK